MPRDDIQPALEAGIRPTRHHVLIAGTGRSGTSFLVRYLDACGLETHLTRAESGGQWDDRANAGFEDLLWGDEHRPYVVKSPWVHQDIDDLLANQAIRLDAVIIPMRDLIEAASSRSIVELQAIHEHVPAMAERGRSWLLAGQTPGGVIYSMDPLDQARLLATGFHHLLQRLVAADVPVILLDFARMIDDADYLHRRLAAILPDGLTVQDAAAAHGRLADPGKRRVADELGGPGRRGMPDGPSYDRLDRIALTREVRRLRAALARAESAHARRPPNRIAARLRRLFAPTQ